MKNRLMTILMGGFIMIAVAENAAADNKDHEFSIRTLLKLYGDKGYATLPNAMLDKITLRSSQGKADDIRCEATSNSDGVLLCYIHDCDEDVPIAREYGVFFKLSRKFIEAKPVIVKIRKCRLQSADQLAAIFEDTLFAALNVGLSRGFLLGSSVDGTPATLKAVDYGQHLSAVLEGPDGVNQAEKLRALIQGDGYTAHLNGDQTLAVAYEKLAITHANMVVQYTAKQMGAQGLVSASPERLYTLTQNLSKLQAQNSVHEVGGTPLRPFTLDANALRGLIESTERGVLATKQFNQLESMVRTAQEAVGAP